MIAGSKNDRSVLGWRDWSDWSDYCAYEAATPVRLCEGRISQTIAPFCVLCVMCKGLTSPEGKAYQLRCFYEF